MTTDGGGVAARRAVVRWAIRLFRRDWRQQILIIVLMTFSVAVAAFGVSAAYNVIPTGDGEFGTANHRLQFAATDIESLAAQTAALEDWFGTIEVVGHNDVPIAGDAASLELRSQDVGGAFSSPILDLVDGRYPDTTTEAAVTDGAADHLGVGVGSVAEIDGRSLMIVGLVENPSRLNDEFVLLSYAEVASAEAYTALVNSTPERAVQLPASVPVGAIDRRPACHAVICLSADQSEQTTGAAAALVVATLLLLLVALVAVAGFVVVAQRRLRQLGMFAANGATDRQVKLVVLGNGAIVGAVSAAAGGALGVGLWVLVAPMFETAANHRIERLHVPLWLIAASLVIAIFTAVGASWKPARALTRISIMSALAARPPRPAPAKRSVGIALVLIALGIVALSQAIDIPDDRVNPLLLISGVASLIVGTVFLAPGLLGAMGRLASSAPIAPRLALRDLSRYRARSSAALAAITLALAIPIAIVVVSTAAKNSAAEGNLSDSQLIIRLGDDPLLVPERTAEQLRALQPTIDVLANHNGADVTPLDVAVDASEGTTRGSDTLRSPILLARLVSQDTLRDIGVLYVATPPVMDLLDLSPTDINGDAAVLTAETGDLQYANTRASEQPATQTITALNYSSSPGSLITEAALEQNGWTMIRAGWFLQAAEPITAAERGNIRDEAAARGLTVEFRDQQIGTGYIRSAATVAGLLIAIGVLALTLGLLRAENTNELRILSATGATSTFRRTLSAATAGILATAGVLLGTLAAYSALAAGYSTQLSNLLPVPYIHLALMLTGVPALATLGGWLLAGREPPTLRRAPIE